MRSPRVYWRDSGLLHALLGVTHATDLLSQPWVGASWEGWVIEQIVSAFHARGMPVEPFWFRTSDGQECDLVLEFQGRRWAIEIKLSAQPKNDDLRVLQTVAASIRADRAILVSRTRENVWKAEGASVNLEFLLRKIATAEF